VYKLTPEAVRLGDDTITKLREAYAPRLAISSRLYEVKLGRIGHKHRRSGVLYAAIVGISIAETMPPLMPGLVAGEGDLSM
jgi:hypothetical protein